ncbi:hypothetical protein [Myroides marinus]|uniref:Uncharacterized protein n=1 Tax=Myroides marinus TaxID=703342 RepID=A0A161SMB0_9FLAO|nr:hypothetical protein [Myroides marinus]KZE83800.1 hypothetical protein AV926_03830 [Myroides marinus]MDM1347271.1 hypothetical protein [Myroides marinus]MDM1354063.1 hypothetical protein [Myroides marinus]MDM1374954.1 hypothetical protein [Myroides marinus]MDM1532226.1 hypothetical protein [Myroides marinus]
MESNQVNLEQLWATPKIEQGNIAEVFKSIDTYRLKKIKMNWILALIGVSSLVWIIVVNVLLKGTEFYGSIWIVLGSIICCLAITMYLISYYRLNILIPSSILTQSTTDYIKMLTKEKKQQLLLSKVWMNVYLLLFTVGIGMYSYPFILKLDSSLIGGYYAVLGIWTGINMYWNKKMGKKKIMNLERMLDALQRIE